MRASADVPPACLPRGQLWIAAAGGSHLQSAHTRRPAQRRRAGGERGCCAAPCRNTGTCSMLLRNLLTKGIGRRLITAVCVQDCVCEQGSDAQVPGGWLRLGIGCVAVWLACCAAQSGLRPLWLFSVVAVHQKLPGWAGCLTGVVSLEQCQHGNSSWSPAAARSWLLSERN